MAVCSPCAACCASCAAACSAASTASLAAVVAANASMSAARSNYRFYSGDDRLELNNETIAEAVQDHDAAGHRAAVMAVSHDDEHVSWMDRLKEMVDGE